MFKRVDCSDMRCDYAHRGLHNDKIPENTIASFENAVANGLAIELDVQMTLDGRIIVFHDSNLKRLCGSEDIVRECNYEKISRLKIGGTDHAVPLLEDVLKVVDGKVPILIEIKDNGNKKRIEAPLMELLSTYKGEYALQSFNNKFVKKIKRISPGTRCGLLIPYFQGMISHAVFYLTTYVILLFVSPDFLSFGVGMSQGTVKRMGRGRPVLGWTVQSREEYCQHKKRFDGLIFEGFLPQESGCDDIQPV